MTDRELLELAAKAFRENIVDRDDDGTLYLYSEGCIGGYRWNPLADDGDALRLAVKLSITIQFPWDEDCNMLRETRCWNASDEPAIEHHSSDKLSATRRAIVRAAAEIGKAMQ